jgi:hypothetical protein
LRISSLLKTSEKCDSVIVEEVVTIWAIWRTARGGGAKHYNGLFEVLEFSLPFKPPAKYAS